MQGIISHACIYGAQHQRSPDTCSVGTINLMRHVGKLDVLCLLWCRKVTTASKHVQDAAAKIRQGRPFHANNKSKQALLNAFDRLIAMVAELVSNE